MNGEQVHRIYLDELGEIENLPIAVAATVLTITDEDKAPALARLLLERTVQEASDNRTRADLIDIVTSIMVYKFTNLSRQEIRAMLGLDLTKEPRAIREAKDEGREEGREQGERSLILRLLTKKIGELPAVTRSQIAILSLDRLELLGESLLDFGNLADLKAWLTENA